MRRLGLKNDDKRPRPLPQLRAIGVVRGAPKKVPSSGWAVVEADVVVDEEIAPALKGLSGYSHAWVLFVLDSVGEDGWATLRQRPPGAPGEVGVFALRTQARPNPIGMTVVTIVRIEGATVRVRGLDAFDGTPVLDLKPYIPYYDSVSEAGVPDWIGHP